MSKRDIYQGIKGKSWGLESVCVWVCFWLVSHTAGGRHALFWKSAIACVNLKVILNLEKFVNASPIS